MNTEQELLDAVVAVARLFPRETPAPGGAATVHQFGIDAGTVWALDKALRQLDDAIAEGRRSSDEQAEVVGWIDRLLLKSLQGPSVAALSGTVYNAQIDDRHVPLYASPPAVAAGGVTEQMKEAAARAICEMAGCIDPDKDIGAGYREWHRYLSQASAALGAALAVGDEGIREGVPIKYVILGRGEWVAGTYMRDGMPSLCFGPAPEPKAPGEKPTDEVSEWATRNGAVVISFANLNAAMQMLDLVRDAVDMKAIRLPTPPSRGEGE